MIERAHEQAIIGRLLADARSGRSGSAILVGEPGVGKSVLLNHAFEQAADMRLLHANGVETEIDLPFAALDQLLRGVLPLTARLPSRQAGALLGALGVTDQATADRFLVGAATLSLVAEAADRQPVLCLIDDAHWLDTPSAQAIAFAARRLDAEGVVVLVACRERPWPGLPTITVGGLGRDDAQALVRERGVDVAGEVLDRLLGETGGNALALAELARSLTTDELTGRQPLPVPLRLNARVQEVFLERARDLPDATQTLLLVAAADDTADVALIFRAAATLGIDATALEPAERAGLASVDLGRFGFRHPLVRAAVYHTATLAGRASAHRALAVALEGDQHAARRSWHLAATASGPDEAIASELERSGAAAGARAGFAVAAAAFERAAALSESPPARARRLLAAANAAFKAGQAGHAETLADRATWLVDAPTVGEEVALLRGRIAFARGSAVPAHQLLMAAGRGIADKDPRTGTAILMEAARSAWNAYDPDRYADAVSALRDVELAPDDPLGPVRDTAIAVGDFMADRVATGVLGMRRSIADWLRLETTARPSARDESFVEGSLAFAGFTRITGEDDTGLALGTAAVAACRDGGFVAWLPWALVNLSMSQALAGRHAAAKVNATEGLTLARDLEQPTAICSCESILAWLAAVRGDEDRCRELVDDAVALSAEHRLDAIVVVATWALGLLELSLGRPDRAADLLADRTRGPLAVPSTRCLITADLVEASVRARRMADAAAMLDWYDEWANATDQRWAKAALLRCRALLADKDPESLFAEALDLHEAGGPDHRPFDRARTQLLFGEWLRRERRRVEARTQLSAARDTFERLGAQAWAERATAELRATGQSVARREPGREQLTPREAQVARLAAEGGSNTEVAARLFLSPRTVAYHLYKAYPKLGVTSRAELARLDLDALMSAE